MGGANTARAVSGPRALAESACADKLESVSHEPQTEKEAIEHHGKEDGEESTERPSQDG